MHLIILSINYINYIHNILIFYFVFKPFILSVFQQFAMHVTGFLILLSPSVIWPTGEKTDKMMGVNEMLVATAICGVIFSLAAGQPLVIIGATGPVLVFEEALFKVTIAFVAGLFVIAHSFCICKLVTTKIFFFYEWGIV